MEDSRIVQLYWDRDPRAIDASAEKYGLYCAAIAWNILGSTEDAEECVNDTWLHAWGSMPPQRPRVLSAFLGRITRNLSLNRYKGRAAQKRGGGELPAVLEELAECVSGGEDVEQAVDRQELAKAIHGFLAALPREKRELFICRYWYTESIPGLARRFGMKENAVSVALNRLRKKLRAYLTERGFEL